MKTIKLPPCPVDSKVDDKWKVRPVLSNIPKATAQRKFNHYLKTPVSSEIPEKIPEIPQIPPQIPQTPPAALAPAVYPLPSASAPYSLPSASAPVYPLPSASADGAPKPLIKFKTALHRLSQLFQNPPSH